MIRGALDYLSKLQHNSTHTWHSTRIACDFVNSFLFFPFASFFSLPPLLFFSPFSFGSFFPSFIFMIFLSFFSRRGILPGPGIPDEVRGRLRRGILPDPGIPDEVRVATPLQKNEHRDFQTEKVNIILKTWFSFISFWGSQASSSFLDFLFSLLDLYLNYNSYTSNEGHTAIMPSIFGTPPF